MATAEEFRAVALSLEGTVEAPHFDRRAFKARRIYATLASDGLTANIRFSTDEQEFRCMLQPEAYRKIANKWGAAGWTTMILSALTVADLSSALTNAWRNYGTPKVSAKRRRS